MNGQINEHKQIVNDYENRLLLLTSEIERLNSDIRSKNQEIDQ